MPIIVTFDQEGSSTDNDRGRLLSMFIQFGWEKMGGTTYRYPKIGSKETEDWPNHVVPALMLLRSYFASPNRNLTRLTIDANVSYAFDARFPKLPKPRNSKDILTQPSKSNQHFGAAKLLKWLEETKFPYD